MNFSCHTFDESRPDGKIRQINYICLLEKNSQNPQLYLLDYSHDHWRFSTSGLCNRYQWGCCTPAENCDQFTMEFKLFATDHQLSANNYVHSFDVTMNYDNDRSVTATANVTINRAGIEEPLLQARLWHDSLPADVTQINPGYIFVIEITKRI